MIKEKLPITGIYAIKNKINGKVYVGSSSDIKYRWKSHLNSLKRNKSNKKLQNAWNKYGKKNFTFEILKVLPKDISTCDLEFYEEIYIGILNSVDCGYNVRGHASSNKGMKILNTENMIKASRKRGSRKVIVYDLNGKFVRTCQSLNEAGVFITGQTKRNGCQYALKSKSHRFGNYLVYEWIDDSFPLTVEPYKRTRDRESKRKPILVVDKQENKIIEFSTIREAAENLKIGFRTIYKYIKSSKPYKDFTFEYKN